MGSDRLDRRKLFGKSSDLFGELIGRFLGAAQEARADFESAATRSDPDYHRSLLESARAPLRPPGARSDDILREKCPGCSDCVEACPEDVLFKADERFGSDHETPIFYPPRKACFLCSEFHCVKACRADALRMPSSPSRVNIGKARIDPSLCLAGISETGCSECIGMCPLDEPAISLLGDRPYIDALRCVGCGLCEHGCSSKAGSKALVTLGRLR